MGVDRNRVCELYAAGLGVVEGSGSGYRLGDRLVLTARHVIGPALSGLGGQVLVRPAGVPGWLPARVEWADADADAALAVIEDEDWRAPTGESVLRWGELAGSDPVPCTAVGFPWASVRSDRARDTAHVYGQLAPLGQLKAGRLDLDVVSASPSARAGGSPWAGMSGAAVIADSHLVGVITADPARYADRLVAVPAIRLLADEGFLALLADHGVWAEAGPVGASWHLRLGGEQAVSLDQAYKPLGRRFRAPPSRLLRPEHGLVPFLGRQQPLKQVIAWCQDPVGRPVLLVTGGGGSGKSRLGREACVRMLIAGWDAGLADDQRRGGTAMDRLERPTLLVVDDADLSTGLITGLIRYMRWDEAGPEVRLLLLARTRGVWWDQLVRQQEVDGNYDILDLDRYPVPPADRAEHFRRAFAAFTAHSGPGAQPVEPPPAAELEDPTYAEPLLIHIDALLRTMDTSPALPPGLGGEATQVGIATSEEDQPLRQRLLRTLCQKERDRWNHLGGQLPFNPDLPLADQVVALATLTAAADQPCALSLLAAVPNQAEITRIGAEALVVWAHRLYSGPGYWNPLRPDLLAEQHLADTPQLPALAISAARLATEQSWEAQVVTQLLAELTLGSPNQPAVRAALHELLAAELARIIYLAISADGAELADLTSLALQLAPQHVPTLLFGYLAYMPMDSVRLAGLAATLTSQQVTHDRAEARGGEPDAASRLAQSLNTLAGRLGVLGRGEDALAATEEAIAIRRELAATHPDERPGLAMSLRNLAAWLSELGRREEARAAAEEATGIYRQLAAASSGPDDELRSGLAASLNNLSNVLAGLERREEALAAAKEAFAIHQKLAASRPDEFRPDLAGAHYTLAVLLGDLGRREEALAATEKAARAYQELATARPDEFRPRLAMALNVLAFRLGDLGRREEALAAAKEAVDTNRQLATARPDAFRRELARSLNNQAIRLGELGRREEALAAIQEAVAIRKELALRWPRTHQGELQRSRQIAARLEHGEDLSDASLREARG